MKHLTDYLQQLRQALDVLDLEQVAEVRERFAAARERVGYFSARNTIDFAKEERSLSPKYSQGPQTSYGKKTKNDHHGNQRRAVAKHAQC